jgi:hypothetical protein
MTTTIDIAAIAAAVNAQREREPYLESRQAINRTIWELGQHLDELTKNRLFAACYLLSPSELKRQTEQERAAGLAATTTYRVVWVDHDILYEGTIQANSESAVRQAWIDDAFVEEDVTEIRELTESERDDYPTLTHLIRVEVVR